MTSRGLLRQDTGFALTDQGVAWFGELGIDLAREDAGRRPAPAWTGPSAAPIWPGSPARRCARTRSPTGWYARIGSQRAVRVTPAGARALAAHLGIDDL